jgi:uncharacterized protein (TIGR00162 family)
MRPNYCLVIPMTTIKVLERPKLRNPVLVVGLPGVGNIGRVAVGYLVSELKAKRFATLHSEWFFPFVMIHEKSMINLLKNEFHYAKGKGKGQRDLILLVGDCQSLSPQGHYDVVEDILDFVKKFGVKEVITIGGLATGELDSGDKVVGSVTDQGIIKKYGQYGIDFNAGDKVGYIVGAAGLMLGLGKEFGMEGVCLLGKTSGFPIVTDPKAAENVLDILVKMFNLRINMKKLEKKVEEMEDFIKKVEGLQMKAVSELAKGTKAPTSGEELRYIG